MYIYIIRLCMYTEPLPGAPLLDVKWRSEEKVHLHQSFYPVVVL